MVGHIHTYTHTYMHAYIQHDFEHLEGGWGPPSASIKASTVWGTWSWWEGSSEADEDLSDDDWYVCMYVCMYMCVYIYIIYIIYIYIYIHMHTHTCGRGHGGRALMRLMRM